MDELFFFSSGLNISSTTELVLIDSRIFSNFFFAIVLMCIVGMNYPHAPPLATLVKQIYSASKPNFPPSSQE